MVAKAKKKKPPPGRNSTCFQLPWPVSTNSWLRCIAGRAIKTKKWRLWLKAAKEAIQEAYTDLPLECSDIAVHVHLEPPTNRRFDIDNFGGKPILDALQGEGGVFLDDDQVDMLTIVRGEKHPGGRALVLVTW
tara:strand:+ start:13547 stop:13945 length:399 start_codon:yes stop_codon:yes gene_type:complete